MKNDPGRSLNVLPAENEPTSAGNYFVSNYPPFSLWTPDRAGEAIDRLGREARPGTPLGLYIHIPFCRKRCHFCYFRVYTDKNKDDIRDYLDAVTGEAEILARQPFVAGRKLNFVYFGGGTPSYLSTKQLAGLVAGLERVLPWDEVEEVAFECEPGTLNEGKLKAIRDFGVTRLSLGIENFDDGILEVNNRAHKSKEVYRAYQWSRAAGFEQINIDLIAGMVGETTENWRRCVDKAIELQPDAVTIYQMEVPHNTTIYRQMQQHGDATAPVADWPTKRAWVAEAFESLEAAGYTIGSAYTAVRNTANTKFVYRDALWSGADMLGIGVSSFGHLDGVHYQNHHDIVPYVSAVAGMAAGTSGTPGTPGTPATDHPIYRAMTMTDEERMIRQFILQLKVGHLQRKPFLERFGTDVFARWGDTLRQYRDEGFLTFDEDALRLTRRGLLEVDRLLHAFFLPEHRGIRYS